MDHQAVRRQRSGQRAKTSYDRLSRWYDLLAEHSESKLRGVGLQMLAAQPGEAILEIGCGPGHALTALARSVSGSGKVYGLDISARMLTIAQARAREAGLSVRVELLCADASRLPFEAHSFDAIFMSFALELFDTREISLVLGECRRVLRNGARICVVAMSRRGRPNLMTRLYAWAYHVFPNYVDCRPIPVAETLERAGFKIANIVETSVWGLPVDIVLAART